MGLCSSNFDIMKETGGGILIPTSYKFRIHISQWDMGPLSELGRFHVSRNHSTIIQFYKTLKAKRFPNTLPKTRLIPRGGQIRSSDVAASSMPFDSSSRFVSRIHYSHYGYWSGGNRNSHCHHLLRYVAKESEG